MKFLKYFIMVLIIFLAGCSTNKENPIQEEIYDMTRFEKFSISFELIHESEYNENIAKTNHGRASIIPFTSYKLILSNWGQEYLIEMSESEGFIPPENFDFENYSLLITYGRQIVELECNIDKWLSTHYDTGKPLADNFTIIPTFGEEHFGEKVFFYKIEDRGYHPFSYGAYIMVGDEKVPF